MPDLVVAGAGMAGLAAAAEASALGADVLLLEKGDRAGGSMLLSSGVVWRHRELSSFHEECPGGDRDLQRLVHARLDEDIEWVRGLGAPVLDDSTGNERTSGVRFDPAALTEALVGAGPGVRFNSALDEAPRSSPLVLSTGGFQASRALVRDYVTPEADSLLLRAAPWSTGDGLRIGLDAGGSPSTGMDEAYVRNMPAPPARVGERDFVRLSQLYARFAEVTNARGERFEPRTWSEIDVAQWTARQPGARAFYRVPDSRLGEAVRERTVGDMIDAAEASGAPVLREDGFTIVEVVAGITTTLGGLRVDASAQVAPGVWAAGADAGGIATGGYASGLAAALVLGRVAARSALSR